MNQNRLYLFYGFLIVGFMVLAARLFELQIIFGFRHRALAEGNRIRKLADPAPRGIIYDREKRSLVRNIPVYRLRKEDCQREEAGCLKSVTREEALAIEASGDGDEELRVAVGREYVYGPALAHVLGYLGEASQSEVSEGKYGLGDLVGRMGVEQAFDHQLRGRDGGEIFEVDNQENKVRLIGKVDSVPGNDVFLSVDGQLNQAAYEALEGKPGAVVATEAKTGRVLVLVSNPSFNPNRITESVLTDTKLPLFNRAIGGVYPPGSTFKIVTAAAGLQEGKIDEETLYEDTGQIKIGEYTYKNWFFTQYGKTEGEIDLVKAIKRSTDTFFYKVGEWVGARKLADWAKAFGLGGKTGIDIPGEVEGLVPDPEWKEQTLGERWFLGNTYHLAIGQADLLATPLQVNMMTSVVANDGKLCLPRVKKPESKRTGECQSLNLKPETVPLIKKGMEEACSSGGTAFPFFDFSPQVACKTGTAEFGDPEDRTHAWLTAFAPAGEPEIVVTALVEAGGEGAYAAAPVVKKVMERYFEQR